MGGVDLLDNMVAVYRIPFRKKKWWFSLYTWSLSVYAVNGWRLRMKHTGKKEPFLDFVRELVICIFHIHGSQPVNHVPIMPIPQSLLNDYRYDQYSHWCVNTESRNGKPIRRNCKMCSLNGKADMKAVNMCSKCKVPLHVGCFQERILKKLMKHGF